MIRAVNKNMPHLFASKPDTLTNIGAIQAFRRDHMTPPTKLATWVLIRKATIAAMTPKVRVERIKKGITTSYL